MLKTLLICFFTSATTWAISEDQVLKEMVLKLDDGSFYKIGAFRSQNGLSEKSKDLGKSIPISYIKFGSQRGKKGSLVIVTGRTESSLKYIEVASDFIAQGYSPVYAIDHRGQGFSGNVIRKKLVDDQIGHVENFNHYVLDFSYFVDFVVLKDPQVDRKNLFLISNSMGSAIALRYFQQNPKNPFKKSAMSGSMFKIKTGDALALLKTVAVCGTSDLLTVGKLDCYGYTPGESPVSWTDIFQLPDGREIAARAFHGNDSAYLRNLTSSESRFRLNDYIWNQWPQAIVAGPSIKWTEQALLAGVTLRTRSELLKVQNKIFLLIANRDFRTDGPVQQRMCKTMGSKCTTKTYDSYHEILMEKDPIRNQALKDIFSYFAL